MRSSCRGGASAPAAPWPPRPSPRAPGRCRGPARRPRAARAARARAGWPAAPCRRPRAGRRAASPSGFISDTSTRPSLWASESSTAELTPKNSRASATRRSCAAIAPPVSEGRVSRRDSARMASPASPEWRGDCASAREATTSGGQPWARTPRRAEGAGPHGSVIGKFAKKLEPFFWPAVGDPGGAAVTGGWPSSVPYFVVFRPTPGGAAVSAGGWPRFVPYFVVLRPTPGGAAVSAGGWPSSVPYFAVFRLTREAGAVNDGLGRGLAWCAGARGKVGDYGWRALFACDRPRGGPASPFRVRAGPRR